VFCSPLFYEHIAVNISCNCSPHGFEHCAFNNFKKLIMFISSLLPSKTITTLFYLFLVFFSFSQANTALRAPERANSQLYKNELTQGKKEKMLCYNFQSVLTSFKKENIQFSRINQFILSNKYYELVPNAKTLFKLSQKELLWLITKDYDGMFRFSKHLKKEFINTAK